MSRRGGRGSKRKKREESFPDFYDKDDQSEDNTKRVENYLGYGNGGETDQWMKSVTEGEKSSIYLYSDTEYHQINWALREEDFASLSYEQAMVIQGALEKANLSKNITLHRGDSGGLIPDTDTLPKWAVESGAIKVGDEFQSRAFVSTSPNKPFVGRDYSYTIRVPKGKGRGAYVKDFTKHKGYENEFLLKAGTKFRITGVTLNPNGKAHITLDVID